MVGDTVGTAVMVVPSGTGDGLGRALLAPISWAFALYAWSRWPSMLKMNTNTKPTNKAPTINPKMTNTTECPRRRISISHPSLSWKTKSSWNSFGSKPFVGILCNENTESSCILGVSISSATESSFGHSLTSNTMSESLLEGGLKPLSCSIRC